jgi:hypothetical protein
MISISAASAVRRRVSIAPSSEQFFFCSQAVIPA